MTTWLASCATTSTRPASDARSRARANSGLLQSVGFVLQGFSVVPFYTWNPRTCESPANARGGRHEFLGPLSLLPRIATALVP
jgi:hypothetical protein